MRLSQAALVVLLLTTAAVASGTPEQAILDTVFATDAKTVLKHLPESVSTMIEALPPKARAAALKRLLPQNWLGAKPQRVDDGINLLRTVNPHGDSDKDFVFLRVTKQINNGLEAVLEIKVCQEICYGGLQVWMSLQDNEWRFMEVRERSREMVRFEDPEFFVGFSGQVRSDEENQVVANLRTINTALVTYLSIYEGFPQDLKQLSGEDPNDPSAEHAMLLDQEFLAEPCVVGGYIF